jgi:hypothetical protein
LGGLSAVVGEGGLLVDYLSEVNIRYVSADTSMKPQV